MAKLRFAPAALRLAGAALLLAGMVTFTARPAAAVAVINDATCTVDTGMAVVQADQVGPGSQTIFVTAHGSDDNTYYSDPVTMFVWCQGAPPNNSSPGFGYVAGEPVTLTVNDDANPPPAQWFVNCLDAFGNPTVWVFHTTICSTYVVGPNAGQLQFLVASPTDDLAGAGTEPDGDPAAQPVGVHIEALLINGNHSETGDIDGLFSPNGDPNPPGGEPTPELDSFVLFGAGALLLGGLYVKRQRKARKS